MVKYYCDICGKEVEECNRSVLPDVVKNEKDTTDEVIPSEYDVCKTCAIEIACVISGLKYAYKNNVFLDNGQEMYVAYNDHEFVWRRRKENTNG